MSFKKNVIANYASQLYVTIAAIVLVPLYVQYMGVEAYGLVGFFAMMQAWFQVLDLGFTPTMTREVARYRGGAMNSSDLKKIVRAMEFLFSCVGGCGALALILASGSIAKHWLKVQKLPLEDVQICISLMAAIVGIRFLTSLYRGVITGFERLAWLSGFNVIVASARFIFIIPVFALYDASAKIFFIYQLLVAIFEIVVLFFKAYRLLPVRSDENSNLSLKPLKPILRFSVNVGLTVGIWLVVTQSDKLILSSLLTLTDYAYFTLAVLVANGVTVVSGPIGSVLIPRLSRLVVENDDVGVIHTYRKGTQLVGVIAIPVALILGFFSEEILWAWTGSVETAQKSANVLTLYALGNGVLSFSAFPYYLQFAKGELRLHVIGNLLLATILVPAMVLGTIHYGVVGAGFAWVTANLLYFIIWPWKVHRKFSPGLHINWLLQDVFPIAAGASISALVLKLLVVQVEVRWVQFLELMGIGLIVLLCAAMSSSFARGKLIDAIRKFSKRSSV